MKSINVYLKTALLCIAITGSTKVVGQQWSPSTSYTDQSSIYRMGKVGIGIANPGANLEVRAATDPYFAVSTPSAAIRLSVASCNTCYSAFSITNDVVLSSGLGSTENILVLSNRAGRSIKFITKNINNYEVLGMELTSEGKLGVGTSSIPAGADLATNKLYLGDPNSGNGGYLEVNGSGGNGYNIASRSMNPAGDTKLFIGVDASNGSHREVFTVESNGRTKIGYQWATNHFDAKLCVDGKIVTKALNVTAAPWADYVFDEDYKLTSLAEVEKYIKENKHLPEIPSEAEVMEQGIDVAKMDALLLKKIEELTLHLIEMQKQNTSLQNRIEALEQK